MRIVFDIETNGLLPDVDTLHCLVLKDIDTGKVWSCHDHQEVQPNAPTLAEGLEILCAAEQVIGHNIVGYDIPVLEHLRGIAIPVDRAVDTQILAELNYPRDILLGKDALLADKGGLPRNLMGRQSLEAWGHRVGLHKGDYKAEMKALGEDPWASWNPAMQSYCEGDVEVTARLWKKLDALGYAPGAVRIEHNAQVMCAQIERAGFPFDQKAGAALYATLAAERANLGAKLTDIFPCWAAPVYEKGADGKPSRIKVVTPLRTVNGRKVISTQAGAPYCPVVFKDFNPDSRDHIADRLIKVHGWIPDEFTNTGKPEVSETILARLPYPEAGPIARYLMLGKRAALLSEGKDGWLRACNSNGLIHHRIHARQTVTRRASHSSPNLAQVPKGGSYLGAECRSLFHAGEGWVLVGVDLSGIELRMLAHYMARWDGGAYARAVVEGRSEEGTDVHSINTRAIGLDPARVYTVGGKQATGRDLAKAFVYAFLYGAGPPKLASILGLPEKKGAALRTRFLEGFPALVRLIEAVQKAAERKYLVALDGGRVPVRSKHAALNTLLQSAGAVVSKKWLGLTLAAYAEKGWGYGTHYLPRAWVHDELQTSAKPEIARELGEVTVAAIRDTGVSLGCRVPLTGEYKVGRTWADTH